VSRKPRWDQLGEAKGIFQPSEVGYSRQIRVRLPVYLGVRMSIDDRWAERTVRLGWKSSFLQMSIQYW
jgi:hypothetical protein